MSEESPGVLEEWIISEEVGGVESDDGEGDPLTVHHPQRDKAQPGAVSLSEWQSVVEIPVEIQVEVQVEVEEQVQVQSLF